MPIKNPFTKFRGKLQGDLLLDPVQRLLFHTSASSNAVMPLAVARPGHAEDIAQLVDFCQREAIPITPRGAGTGMAGVNVGPGLVLDFCRYMRQILDLDVQAAKVLVQPGMIYGDLNRQLAKHGLFLPPDPSSGDFCTVGGMVANNAGGPHTLKYGATRDYVCDLQGITADANIHNFSSVNALHAPWLQTIRSLLLQNENLIQHAYPQVNKNSSGYLLQNVLQNNFLDLPKLLCGSEGSLAIFSQIEFRVLPLPRYRGLLFALFDSLEAAGQAVISARERNPSAIEIIDHSLLQDIKHRALPMAAEISPMHEAALLIEAEGEELGEVDLALHAIQMRIEQGNVVCRTATEQAQQQQLWQLRKEGAVRMRRNDWKKPIRVIEDAVVPPEKVPEYIRAAKNVLRRHQIEAVLLGHAGNGNIHVEPLLDVLQPNLPETIAQLAEEMAEIVKKLGGTLSGEHGDGIVRSAYLPQVYPQLYPLFQNIKKTLDPNNILNPGAVIPDKQNRSLQGELRYNAMQQSLHPALKPWHFEIERCFSCGLCRSYCPSYEDSGQEERLPRARASLLRGILYGLVAAKEVFSSEAAKKIFQYCENCTLCLTKCPAGFNNAMLVQKTKALFISEERDSSAR